MNSTPSIPGAPAPAARPPARFVDDGSQATPPQAAVDGRRPDAATSDGGRVIPVVEERLKIRRRTVETGRATRVRKVVREHCQELELPTVHEDVHVERVPVGRRVAGPLDSWEEGDVLVIPVVEERLVVRTEYVLREEIRVSRRRRTERSVHAVTLRREVAIVERLDPATGDWTEIDAGTQVDAGPSPARDAIQDPGPRPEAAPRPAPSDDRKTIHPRSQPQGAPACTP